VHRQYRRCLQQLHDRYHHRPSPSFTPIPPMHPGQPRPPQTSTVRLLPIAQKAKTDLTANPNFCNGWLLVGRIRHCISLGDPDSLLRQLLWQRPKLRPHHAMPQAPLCRPTFLPDRLSKGPYSQDQLSTTSDHSHCEGITGWN
jgi:hypothetical protein